MIVIYSRANGKAINQFWRAAAFLLATSATLACASPAVPSAQTSEPEVIADISTWHHPVKKVFEENSIPLTKVELTKNRTFPVFFVVLKFDPQSSETSTYFDKLYYDLLKANSWWAYALMDETDGIRIDVHWDKISSKLVVETVPLNN